MTETELLDLIEKHHHKESEILEFKEWKRDGRHRAEKKGATEQEK